jgi:S-adenosylmethionine:tRNA ribosyltransferase-isomerase
VLVSDFDYQLPKELIAREPLPNRAAARMLHLKRSPEVFADRAFTDFSGLLRPDDLLVVNNTRVLPARLFGHRSGSRAQPVSQSNPAVRDYLRGTVEVSPTSGKRWYIPGANWELVNESILAEKPPDTRTN